MYRPESTTFVRRFRKRQPLSPTWQPVGIKVVLLLQTTRFKCIFRVVNLLQYRVDDMFVDDFVIQLYQQSNIA
jgi:hypothetical protein